MKRTTELLNVRAPGPNGEPIDWFQQREMVSHPKVSASELRERYLVSLDPSLPSTKIAC